MNQNQKITETMSSLDDIKRVKAPEGLKSKILENLSEIRQDAKIVPMRYYYRAASVAAMLLIVNLIAISNVITNREKAALYEEYATPIGSNW
jgi:hypothetical protein